MIEKGVDQGEMIEEMIKEVSLEMERECIRIVLHASVRIV